MRAPILSICIPIYNRSKFLIRMLDRFIVEMYLFEEDIELLISDNCSEEDLEEICIKYQIKGLKLNYHRNKTNLGMDGNFISCFKHAHGKYTWLLGSDDIPSKGVFDRLLPILRQDNVGTIHMDNLRNKHINKIYTKFGDYVINLNSYITFISGMIVNTTYVKNVKFDKYKGTFISQVPLYLEAAYLGKKNIVVYGEYLEGNDDSKFNSGYNLFTVFVVNLLRIIYEQVEKGRMSEKDYYTFKKLHFKNLLAGEIGRRLIFKTNKNLKTSSAYNIIWSYYGKCTYMYYYIIIELLKSFFRKLKLIK